MAGDRPALLDELLALGVTLRGVDERTLQPVFARALFDHGDLVLGQGFADVNHTGPDGVSDVDLSKLDALVPRPLTRGSPAPDGGSAASG